jgi:hypothetical protein
MIYTFYSFKGGVGRSMALANVAELLYQQGLRVLMVDFDLEAPGLERFFDVPKSMLHTPGEIMSARGIVDMLLSYKELRSLPRPHLPQAMRDSHLQDAFPFPVEPLTNFIVPLYKENLSGGSLAIIPAGQRRNADFARYANQVRSFDWNDFYRNRDGEQFFEWFRQEAEAEFDVVLIDSRTGVTEMGGVCNYQLADVVILFVAPNQQNVDGTKWIAESLLDPQLIEEGRKGRPLSLVFVPSRIEHGEKTLLDDFERRFNEILRAFPNPNLTFQKSAFIDLKIPYVPYFAYEEGVAAREPDHASASDLVTAYRNLTLALAKLAPKDHRVRTLLGDSRPLTVFLSYEQADVTEIRYLQRLLKLRGIRTWNEVADLQIRENKDQSISAIEQESDAFVVYITRQSLTSQFIWEIEVPAALRRWERERAYNIIPILRGITFDELDQHCAAHGLRSLKMFKGASLPERVTAATNEMFNREFRPVAKLVLEASLALRLRRAGSDRKYEPCLYLHTYKVESPDEHLDLDLDWTELFPGKDDLPSESEWNEMLFPALDDVKAVLTAKISSRRLHIYVQADLAVAFALGYSFPARAHFTLVLEGQHGIWRTDGSASSDEPLREQFYDSSDDSQVAVMEIAIARDTAPAVTQSIPTLGILYKHRIHFTPLSGPDYISGVKDASQALAMSHQIGRELRRFYDMESVTHVHLFAAVPVSFAVMMGHQMNALGTITFYHFLEKNSLYVPMCTFGK